TSILTGSSTPDLIFKGLPSDEQADRAMLIKTEESAIERRDFLIESSTNDFEIAFVKVLVNVLVTGAKDTADSKCLQEQCL
ncbi:MAG: hypothetical protein SPL31_06635, partial [Succinivibrio sp.]|nr:hypothetical protein [Succinivibrio sp.]